MGTQVGRGADTGREDDMPREATNLYLTQGLQFAKATMTPCQSCGKPVPDDAAFCPYCGTTKGSQASTKYTPPPPSISLQPVAPLKRGSMVGGIAVGFVLLVALFWLPVVGALIAGLVAGLVACGARRGAMAGFVAGIIGGVVGFVILTALGTLIGGIFGAGLLGGLIGAGIGAIGFLLAIVGAVLAAAGGAIGGALRTRKQ